ncbi:GntR family transcriptional regulator [Paenibacillus sp. Marseille-Q4541]|uniref:GntR family transcriptional regulator n=1 Tax=Paenibacillus sp. Marseille-Q4541 TaxID=2831522 RepID=UPI001BA67180|nr:GntR family transcriptional regulator [Paenibacillus sp. Marseille-Q4541]
MSEEMDIMDHFVMWIESGKYEPYDKLPSENEVADRFKVPRITARKAYEKLQELGYIYSMQGKGSFVKDRQQRISLVLSADKSFSRKMIELGYNYQSRNILCEKIEFNQKIYEILNVDEQDSIYRVDRLRFIDDRPIALHSSFVSEAMFPEIGREGKEIYSMFQYYESKGFREFQSTQTQLRLTHPSKMERELLECSSLIPLIVIESECTDKESGNTLEYSKIMYRGDLFTYVI